MIGGLFEDVWDGLGGGVGVFGDPWVSIVPTVGSSKWVPSTRLCPDPSGTFEIDGDVRAHDS